MAIHQTPELTAQIGERIRPDAETVLGLILLCRLVSTRLDAVACEASADVIDDGVVGQFPVTKAHFVAFRGLISTIAAIDQNAQLMAMLRSLTVRADYLLIPALPEPDPTMEPLPAAVRFICRPLAVIVRRFRRYAPDATERVIPRILEGLADADVIDDGRAAEHLAPPVVGYVRTFYATIAQMVGSGVNTETVADATDSLCTWPYRG